MLLFSIIKPNFECCLFQPLCMSCDESVRPSYVCKVLNISNPKTKKSTIKHFIKTKCMVNLNWISMEGDLGIICRVTNNA